MKKQSPPLYAVFGNPVKHSLSPQIHRIFAEQLCAELEHRKKSAGAATAARLSWQLEHLSGFEYKTLEAPLDAFAEAVREFFGGGGSGANVTIPFKHEAYELGKGSKYPWGDGGAAGSEIVNLFASIGINLGTSDDSTSPENSDDYSSSTAIDKDAIAAAHKDAYISGSANTIYVSEQGEYMVANTDGHGLVQDIRVNCGWNLEGKNILVLGAGGAVGGVLPRLRRTHCGNITLMNRTAEKGERLVKKIKSHHDEKATAELVSLAMDKLQEGGPQKFDLIINGTAVGLGDEQEAQQFFGKLTDLIHPDIYSYDLVYKLDGDTAFIKWAKHNGVMPQHTADGLGMLVEQAALSFAIWHGWLPASQAVLKQLRSKHS